MYDNRSDNKQQQQQEDNPISMIPPPLPPRSNHPSYIQCVESIYSEIE